MRRLRIGLPVVFSLDHTKQANYDERLLASLGALFQDLSDFVRGGLPAMSVFALISSGHDRNVVDSDQAFQDARGLEGRTLLIKNLDPNQLSSPSAAQDANTSYDLRVGQEYRDHRDIGKSELLQEEELKLLPGSAVVIETEESVHFPRCFSMDQTALKNQVLFRHQRQCSEDPDLDCCLDLFAGGNCPQAFGTAGESLPNSTDSQCHAFRESAHFTGSGSTIFSGRLTRRPQAVDSVQLLTGHY
jgi:hypothetical protein